MNQLIDTIKKSGHRIFLEFGGQGAPWLKELAKLFQSRPELDRFFKLSFNVLERHRKTIEESSVFEEGFDLEKWLKDTETAPSDNYLMRANVSIPAIMITQSAQYLNFILNGYPIEEIASLVSGGTGHSQGVVAAAMAAITMKKGDFYTVYEKFFEYQLLLGIRAQESYLNFNIGEEDAALALELGDKNPAPMAAVIGYQADEIVKMVESINEEAALSPGNKIYAALFNTPESIVISGPISSLLLFRKKYKQEMDEKKHKFVYLRTTAPFHCPHMKGCEEPFKADLEKIQFSYKADDLAFPVYSFFDGRNFQESSHLGLELFAEVALKPLYWEKAVRPAIEDEKVGIVFDFGPGKTIQSLTQSYIPEGDRPRLLCVANPKDAKEVFG